MIRSEVDFSDVPAADLFSVTEAVISAWARIQPATDRRIAPLRWRMWQVGDLVLSESHFGGMKLIRSGRDFPQYDNEYLLLEIYETGWSRARIDDQRLSHQAGNVYLIDMSRAFQSVADGVRTRGILIPHASIGYDPSVHAAVMELPGQSPHGRVLAHAVWTLPDRIEHVNDAEAQELGRSLINVVRALMLDPNTRVNGDDVRAARRLAMENFVEAQLPKSQLGVDLLCRTFGVSRASLYRHFPEAGGVAAYVRTRRLAAAHRDLQRSELTKGRIKAVSERWGFTDPGHFHRVFKRAYQISPSEAVEQSAGPSPASVSPSDLLAGWPHGRRV